MIVRGQAQGLAFARKCTPPDGQIASLNQKSCQAPPTKIFVFRFSELHDYPFCVPPPLEGRIAIVTDVGSGMRWTRGGSARWSRRRKHPRGRPSRVVLIPRRWDQAYGMAMSALTDPTRRKPAGDGGYQARHTGESTKQPLKPSRRECRLFRPCLW